MKLFQQYQVFTSLHLKSPVHVVPPQKEVTSEGENQFLSKEIWELGVYLINL
jgi:hypothetical protein